MCKTPECLKKEEHDPKECTPEQIRECHDDIEIGEYSFAGREK